MMSDKSHPVDDALRRLAAEVESTEQDRRVAEGRLNSAIATEIQGQVRWHRSATVRWALAALIVAVGVVLLFQVIRPTPTRAAIEEIAVVVEASDPLTIPPQQYAYTKSQTTSLRIVPKEGLGDVDYGRDLLVYLLPAQREIWIGSDGVVRVRTTAGPPIFFRAEDETVYYAANLDTTDMVEETVTETMRLRPDPHVWPQDRAELDEAIRASANRGDRPEPVEYIDEALDVIRERLVSPQTRANALRLISEQPGLRLEAASGEGETSFAIDYDDAGVATSLRFIIDPEGHLLEETETLLESHPLLEIPAGTTTNSNTYSLPMIVRGLDAP